MKLTSDAFADGEELPRKYTCDGSDTSPPLRWTDAPGGTKSFAVTCEDPDAPYGVFKHWGIFNIPAEARQLPEGLSDVDYSECKNDFGNVGYGGACPPRNDGAHRYQFRVYALDAKQLDVPAGASIAKLQRAAKDAAIETAEITARYQR